MLGLTDNAVRAHLDALEGQGLVKYTGIGQARGAPARLYDLVPEAELLFSTAYPPMLKAILAVLPQRTAVLKAAGRRLAGGRADGPLRVRVKKAADVLRSLGGDPSVRYGDRKYELTSTGCPLGAHCCEAIEAMLEKMTGGRVTRNCQQGVRPSCRFEIA